MKLFVIAGLFAVAYGYHTLRVTDLDWDVKWMEFKEKYNKSYSDHAEERLRFKIFHDKYRQIEQHNEDYHKNKVSFMMGINQFSDQLASEVASERNGLLKKSQGVNKKKAPTFIAPHNVRIPDSFDWREHGAVTPVKDQKQCGSCWAFSATGSLEGQHFRKTGKLVSLSEQDLVDCSRIAGNYGCEGGLMNLAFDFISKSGGIDTEDSYPYEAADKRCRFNKNTIGATDRGHMNIAAYDEDALKTAVATVGPISVAIDARHESFQSYSSGIYVEPSCNSQTLDHGVLVVGYGHDASGLDYWIIKNSWGTVWGEDGYIRMARNQENMCGVASLASYPLV